jgi:all-trans-retinol dehydrogenase (NAD+)
MNNIIQLIIDTLVYTLQFFLVCFQNLLKVFTRVERDVSGDVVLITGSGSGIGREMALEYAKLGAKVVCWDMNEANNQETVKCIKSNGQIAFGFT